MTSGQMSVSAPQFVFDFTLSRIGFGGLNSNLRPVIYGSYINYNSNTVTPLQFPP